MEYHECITKQKPNKQGYLVVLISAAFSLYLTDVIRFGNQSMKTEENHLVCQKALIRFFGDIEIESLVFQDIREFKFNLGKTRSPETVRNYIIKLRVVLKFLRLRGVAVIDPETIAVPKRTDKVPSFISASQVRSLIDSTSRVRNKAIISMLYASGVRVSELCALNRLDIKDSSFTVVGKGGRARLCFLDNRTRGYLQTYIGGRGDNEPALFLSFLHKKRMTPGNVQEILKVARQKACLDVPVTPHTLRHSFATNLLKNNMNMRYVQELLGHASLETTQMYTHVVNHDLAIQYEKHHTI